MKIKNGYHKLQLAEPLILEPEDWSPSEWAALCNICNPTANQTERIVLHVETMEFFENLEKQAEDADRTYEMCPHCESEIEMRWNTDTMGFYAFCPVCGNRLMLCDECQHSGGGPCDYSGESDRCRHNPTVPASAPKPAQLTLRVETPLGALLARVTDDHEHPGFWIDLRRPDADQDLPLAMVEFCGDEGDLPDGEQAIITRVWGTGEQESYTDRIVHRGIEDFFKTEEEKIMSKQNFTVCPEIKINLTQQDIDNIMVTALEGGICYWCRKAEVAGEYLGECASDQISRGGSLILYDAESSDKWELTLEKFLNGMKLYCEGRNCIRIEEGRIDPGDIDADDADCIIQFGLFGDLVFG